MSQPQGLHFVTGEKGGIGKSLYCMVLLEYCLKNKLNYLFADADRTSPDVGLIYEPETYGKSSTSSEQPEQQDNYGEKLGSDDLTKGDELKPIYFSEDEEDIFLADQLLDLASNHLVIVNLPAQVSVMVDRWLQERSILNMASEEQINITFWFVTDGSPESLNLLEQSLLKYQQQVDHIVVLNEGMNKRIRSSLTNHSVFKSLSLNNHALSTLVLPALSLSIAEKTLLKTQRLPLGKASERHHQSPLTLIAKQRIKQFLRQSHQEISELGIFSDEKTSEAEEAS